MGLSNSCWWDDWDWWNYGELWGIMGNYGEFGWRGAVVWRWRAHTPVRGDGGGAIQSLKVLTLADMAQLNIPAGYRRLLLDALKDL